MYASQLFPFQIVENVPKAWFSGFRIPGIRTCPVFFKDNS